MKILIIENKIRIIRPLREALEEQGHSCLVASDGLAGRKMMLSSQSDFIIIDSDLAKLNGLDLCKSIRSMNPDVPVILLVTNEPGGTMAEGFDAGADDCLLKPFEMDELLVRIRALIKRKSGKKTECKKVLSFADIEMNLDTRSVKRNNIDIDLTPKEFLLLEYMMRNQGKVLSKEEIAQNVWHRKVIREMNFVNVYINYLRNKIDKNFSRKTIHTKPWMGYILMVEE
jgi:DNA-binding response OmpR family regulator